MALDESPKCFVAYMIRETAPTRASESAALDILVEGKMNAFNIKAEESAVFFIYHLYQALYHVDLYLPTFLPC